MATEVTSRNSPARHGLEQEFGDHRLGQELVRLGAAVLRQDGKKTSKHARYHP